MRIRFTDKLLAPHDLEDGEWSSCEAVRVTRYWSGAEAPVERHFEVRALWNTADLLVRFDCNQSEPLVVSDFPQLAEKTVGLWDRDVCEVFIAPDVGYPYRYFEFEVAPTGEWVDLGLHALPGGRETDFDFASGMRVHSRSDEGAVCSVIAVPWRSLGIVPKSGALLKGNLFRCVGQGEGRGYLSWKPTLTEAPDFHVPEAFGEFQLF